ncbi:MAG: polysaccharide biosynthesis C-terminal domain-containing protein [Gaiellaceae bacterium]
MRLLRRNALGVYAVYAAAIASGLVVTPIVVHSLGKSSFGIWSFIGSVTIYLSILDFGVGPSIVRFGAEARGRRADEDLNAVASTGLAIYGAIGFVTLPLGLGLAWLVPWIIGAPHARVWDARIATALVVAGLAARFPLGLFNNLLVAQQRWDLQNLGNFVSTALYAVLVAVLMPHHGSLILLGVLTLATTVLRLALPLAWLRRELPTLRIRRSYVTRARLREIASFSSSNFLVHIAQKIVFSTDVVVVAIVLGSSATGVYSIPAKLFALAFGIGTALTSLMFPAFAELEGEGALDRQRRLLLTGLRGGTALMLLLALPLLLVPDLLIRGWIGKGYGGSYTVMAILAAVLLVHQPIYVLTQFLIARARQREVAWVSIVSTIANLALSFALARIWGLWGVALSTLLTDAAALIWIVPRLAAPAARCSSLDLVRAVAQPLAAASVASAAVLVAIARTWEPRTLPTLAVLGVVWAAAAGASIWWFGLSRSERASIAHQVRPGAGAQVPLEPGGI